MLSSRERRWSCHFSLRLGSLERRFGARELPSSHALGKLSKERVFARLEGKQKKNYAQETAFPYIIMGLRPGDESTDDHTMFS